MNEPITVILLYIDPGAAGFIIVSVLGFLSAAGYLARAYLIRMKRFVFRQPAPPEGTPDQPDTPVA